MLDALITSKTRIKILLKFFLNKNNKSYLRSLEQEFGESSNAIRIELNRFEDAGLLRSHFDGNKKFFQANTSHPLFKDIHSILLKMVGIDTIIENIAQKLQDIDAAYLTGDFAHGIDSQTIDLIFVGNQLDIKLINNYIRKAERIINRKIQYTHIRKNEQKSYLQHKPSLLIWTNEK
ncbi:ArsR family transcriptional regulator [uncultured Sunxiuqinia sp.]|uniref:ArsR family transcriptional regulator n=1 Tax=uncultured Sunxiuqinia sp. TaxID=1573825 RepID=UPI002621A8F9|nr:ArsR family transcriptional regulator [uncultured Sunxiuqinia sp.]